MKQIILGTAGHIDHGKTSLIRALTGIDTDRLKEEKLRGITIELGFAHLDLPSGDRLGIVDVPGHEKFVKHMVAGASGIDLVALVIAADEGVMPQTREHLEICELLRVKRGLVVLTKMDLVDDPDWVEMVKEDISKFLKGTFLEGCPIFPVSAATGEGISELKELLNSMVAQSEMRSPDGPFRLPVDRVFTMRGFGTVVTGTSLSGRLRVGDPVIIYPQEKKSKVRGLQVHALEVEEIFSGQRTAINLQGLERELIQRGNVVASPGALVTTHMVDVHLELLASAPRPLKNRSKVRFHTGTAEHLGTAVLLDREQLEAGEKTFVQIRLDHPVGVLRGDRFVLRSYSPVQTIGGGAILHPLPKKHKGQDKIKASRALETLLSSDESEILLWHVKDAGWFGISEEQLRIRANVTSKAMERFLPKFVSQRQIIFYDKENRRMLHWDTLEDLKGEITEQLSSYHKRFPLKKGMLKEELLAQMPRPVEVKLYNYVLRLLAEEHLILQEKEWVRLASHKVDLTEREESIRMEIEKAFKEAGLQVPFFRELSTKLAGTPRQHQDILQWMLSKGILVKVKEDMYFHRDNLSLLQNQLIEFLKENGEITTSQFKDMIQVSRKYTIPLLEHFDAQRITIRIGDSRKLREGRSS